MIQVLDLYPSPSFPHPPTSLQQVQGKLFSFKEEGGAHSIASIYVYRV
jgi:hypothetical protein